MKSFDSILCKITGRRFQFHATLKYTPDNKNGRENVTQHISFSCTKRCSKTMYREVKKHYAKSFFKSIPRYLLKNGKFEIESISYLGFFK